MNRIKFNRIVQIIYPLFVYYILYNVSFSLFQSKLGGTQGNLVCLMLAGIITIFPIIYIYHKIPKLIPDDDLDIKKVLRYLLFVCIVIAIAIGMNVLISQTNIIETSNGFARAEMTLLDGEFVVKIMCNALVIPILEEVLYRGIIAGQLCLWHGVIFSTIISSFCFGISHFNIVQFLYAFIVGLALAFMYCKTKRLSLCIISHALINLIVIIFS